MVVLTAQGSDVEQGQMVSLLLGGGDEVVHAQAALCIPLPDSLESEAVVGDTLPLPTLGETQIDHSIFLLPLPQLLVPCVGMTSKQSQSDFLPRIFQNQVKIGEILPKLLGT